MDVRAGRETAQKARPGRAGEAAAGRKETPMKTQTFGIEIEMNHITRQRAAQVVAETLGEGATFRHALLDKMDAEIARIKSTGAYDEAASRVTGFPMGAMIYDYSESTYSYDAETKEMTVIEFDIRSHFDLAGKILSEGSRPCKVRFHTLG